MAKGHWSFLHEWVIYDFLIARSKEGTLRFKQVIASGKLLGKSKWVKIVEDIHIAGTSFPDVKAIKLKGSSGYRPAEIKFTTSLFNYHKDTKSAAKFLDFIAQRGFILVLAHDYLPTAGLIEKYPEVDVYEIELEDFISYCRENFSRLLNRQIKAHNTTRIWIMYQGPNFVRGSSETPPATETLRWCPTENLNGFDLAPGDRVLFIKTSGIDTQKLQKMYLSEKIVSDKWLLVNVHIAEVTSKIFSRFEYNQFKKNHSDKQLWPADPAKNGIWRWNRVFEFKKIKSIERPIKMLNLFNDVLGEVFVIKALEVYCYGISREISHLQYRNFLEAIT